MITFDKTSHPSDGKKAEEEEEEEIRITPPPTFVEEKKISWIIDESTNIEFVMKRRGDSFFLGKNQTFLAPLCLGGPAFGLTLLLFCSRTQNLKDTYNILALLIAIYCN